MPTLINVFTDLLTLLAKPVRAKGTKRTLFTPFWILDSGAFLYFSEDKLNFVTFKVLAMPLPIYTANRSTLITGKGTIILKHLSSQNKEVIITVKLVFFCKDLTCQLLSLGTFL